MPITNQVYRILSGASHLDLHEAKVPLPVNRTIVGERASKFKPTFWLQLLGQENNAFLPKAALGAA